MSTEIVDKETMELWGMYSLDHYNPGLISQQDIQDKVKKMVGIVVVRKDLKNRAAAREIGVSHSSFQRWFTSKKKGYYVLVCKSLIWACKNFPADECFEIPELGIVFPRTNHE